MVQLSLQCELAPPEYLIHKNRRRRPRPPNSFAESPPHQMRRESCHHQVLDTHQLSKTGSLHPCSAFHLCLSAPVASREPTRSKRCPRSHLRLQPQLSRKKARVVRGSTEP